MLEKLQMYINGEWIDSHSTETIEVMNPSCLLYTSDAADE